MVNPEDYVIKRRRKKYRFALFANAGNCYEFADWQKRVVDVVELGAGTGLFSVELAERHPEKVFLAVDVKADRLQKGARAAIERGLDNIFFLRARADQLSDIVTPNSLSAIWLTFPDPFPRRRSAGRRLTHPNFLKAYRKTLDASGELCLKHDDIDFFHYSLEQLVDNRWRIDGLSFDLHESEIIGDALVMTTYESKWLSEGKKINYLKATPSA